MFCYSLPANQDCHEMWSKKKRKKEGKVDNNNNIGGHSGKPKQIQHELHHESSTSKQDHVYHTDPPLDGKNHTVVSSQPHQPNFNKSTTDHKPVHHTTVVKPQLSVPLPTVPLPATASILESLNTSTITDNTSTVNEQLPYKKVIAQCSNQLTDGNPSNIVGIDREQLLVDSNYDYVNKKK